MKKVIIIAIVFAAMLFGVPKIWNEKAEFANSLSQYDVFTLKLSESGEIITLTPAEYLIGCLYAQIPLTYHDEALKAQAVAAHTYALRFIKNNSRRPDPELSGALLTDDGKSFQPYYTEEKAKQIYGEEYDLHYSKVKEAAEYGAGNIILYNNEPIYAVYHNVSSGVTNTAASVWGKDFPYLKSVSSTWDKTHPGYLSENELAITDMQITLLEYDREVKIPPDYTQWFTNPKTNDGEYVEEITIGSRTFSGGDIWRIFNLRSPAFTATYNGTAFSFETKGLGHGVGLSQYGADYLANRNYTAEDILNYYYSGVKIKQ